MRGRHDYNDTCVCYRCKGIRNDPRRKAAPKKRVRKPRTTATRAEQEARRLDAGPGAWDDR